MNLMGVFRAVNLLIRNKLYQTKDCHLTVSQLPFKLEKSMVCAHYDNFCIVMQPLLPQYMKYMNTDDYVY